MTTAPSRVTIHMVASADGFIARGEEHEDFSWLQTTDSYAKGAEEANVEEFLATIGCYVIGSRTYELARRLGWPYGDTPTFVLTRRELPVERPSVQFYAGDPGTLVNERLKPRYQSIWLVGGAMLVREFLRLNLADDIRLTIAPIILGGGVPFFDHIGQTQALHLKDVTAYKSGFVELWYEIRKAGP